jgi:hypothetical protein
VSKKVSLVVTEENQDYNYISRDLKQQRGNVCSVDCDVRPVVEASI